MLRNTRLREHGLSIFAAALKAADPEDAVERHLALRRDEGPFDTFDRFDTIYVVGAGKASASMGRAVERALGERITAGLVNVKYGHTVPLRRIELNECGHPVPDEAGVRGAARIAEIARAAGVRDLIVCVISGGASALLPLPAPPVSLGDKQRLTQLLLDCGADIHQINCLRKHVSMVKGGQMARLAYPARILTLILSDVIGDDLDTIGSGPTVPDRSTLADAAKVLERFDLWMKIPPTIAEHLRRAKNETPKPEDPIFANVENVIVGSNRLAVDAAAEKARQLGYTPLVLSSFIQGETREAARFHAAIAREVAASGRPVRAPACLISGGETTVTLRGNGKGGRNQEFALAAALDIQNLANVMILSGGTDGTDGPTDATGAMADETTVGRGFAAGMNAAERLADNDSYHFFQPLGDLIKTGPTGTNVMDIRLVLIGA